MAERTGHAGAGTLTETYLLMGNRYGQANDIRSARMYLQKAVASASKPEHAAAARLGLSACYLQERNFKAAAPLVNSVAAMKGVPPQLMQAAQQMQAYIQAGGK